MKYILLLSLSIAIATITFAQDSNTATSKANSAFSPPANNKITSPNSLSGTYTIGGVAPDYATFSAAAADLSSQGVSGPVVFIVAPGTYNEQVVINIIPGASAINRIAFQSLNADSASVILTFPSSAAATNNYTLRLNGADYVAFSKMTFSRSGNSLYSTIVELDSAAENIIFSHNRFLGATGVTAINTDGSRSCIFSPATSSHTNLIIDANYFKDNANGIWVNGDPLAYATGTIVSNNKFENFYVGAFLLYQDAPMVSGNIVVRNNTTSAIDYYGISIRYCTGSLLISKNKITAYAGSYGIRLRACNGNAAAPGIVANNFVQEGDATAGQCISYEDDCSFQYTLYNSANHTGAGTAGRALYIIGAATAGMEFYNNIFCNAGGGFGTYVNTNATAGVVASDYNCIFSTGAVLAYWGGNANTLAALKVMSGKEVHSLSGNPLYTSANDLHANAFVVNNTGTPIIGVSDDIDGNTRSLTAPDMGADEFTPTGFGNIIDSKALKIYPNPAADNLFIEPVTGLHSNMQVSVFNGEGKIVLKNNFDPAGKESTQKLFIGDLPNGNYFIRLTSGSTVVTDSFIKAGKK